MPWSNIPKEKWGEMESCVMDVMKSGKDKESATAICTSSILEGKSIEDATGDYEKAIALHDISNGNSLKAISKTDEELRVANYIVLFGGRDLEWLRSGANKDGSKGEYFTPKTKFESAYTKAGILYVDWEHGQGKAVDGADAPGVEDVLGYVDWRTAKVDEKGVFVERVLSRRSEYIQMLEELIDAGLIGTSTQAVDSGIKRSKTGEIKAWPLYRDSLTVSPAEPRMMTENVITALKNLAEVFPGLKVLPDEDEPDDFNFIQLRAKAFLLLTEGDI